MSPSPPRHDAIWYRSFYFRIGFSFVIFVVAVLGAQGAMFSYMMARSPTPAFPGRSPNNLAAIVAADIGSVLTQDPALDVAEYVRHEYEHARFMYVVMKDGRVAANTSQPLAEGIRRTVDAALAGTDFSRGGEPRIEGPPTVMAPIQVAGTLRGMVVLPPLRPGSPVVRDLGRMLSVPGTALLIVATTLAAAFIFAPARRRLKALEAATERLGAGDLSARAPEGGGDEIAHVAQAFNRMALELAARDEALRRVDHLRRQMLADVSHELKTPLTAMRGYLETLRMSDVELDPPVSNARRVEVVVPGRGSDAGGMRSLVKGRGRILDATIAGVAREIDLALLKVDDESLPALPIADYDALRQGELVFAFGSPEGLRNSVTMGLVSAVARQPDPDNPLVSVQTDAPINHGNSGGPLVNERPHDFDRVTDLVDPQRSLIAKLGIFGVDITQANAGLAANLRVASGVIVAGHTKDETDSVDAGLMTATRFTGSTATR